MKRVGKQGIRPSATRRGWKFLPGFAVIAMIMCGVSWGQSGQTGDDSTPVTIAPIQRRPGQARPRSNIRLDVNLVLIPVLVTDLYDRPIRGLGKENFRLFEGAAEQTITQFFSDDAPVSVGLVFDSSNSMMNKIEQTRKAAAAFLHMSTPGDEFFLVKFSDRPEPVCDFTQDPAEIEQGVQSIQPAGWTSMFDAIYLAIHQMKHARHGRKVLLVLSDGGDNNSRYTESEVRHMVQEADVRIFSISIGAGAPGLERLSTESGGRALRVKAADDLPELAANLSTEIHSEYVLGYSPSDSQRDGKYRKVKVELIQPGLTSRLHTSWKHGYYGPTQ
jgi:Ca-activated chloride channel family protein